ASRISRQKYRTKTPTSSSPKRSDVLRLRADLSNIRRFLRRAGSNLSTKIKKGGGHLDSPPVQNVHPGALNAKSPYGQAGPTIQPVWLLNVQVTPETVWGVAVKTNA